MQKTALADSDRVFSFFGEETEGHANITAQPHLDDSGSQTSCQMKLPNAALARVERQKIREYLLNRKHPDNGGKADFFTGLGFSVDKWRPLAEAIHSLATNCVVTQSMDSLHGKKYIVDGEIVTPSGKAPVVRTVWIVDLGETIPRLVTAYPHEE